jgi:hypothetical protein
MSRLSVRHSGASRGALLVLTGLGLGFLAGFVLRGAVGGVDRRRLRSLPGEITGQYPAPSTRSRVAGLIVAALDQDDELREVDFEVVPVRPGQVELHGWVPSRAAGARAIRLAGAASRDTDVINRLLVRGEDDLPEPTAPPEERQPA